MSESEIKVRKKYRKIETRIWNDEKFYTATLSCQHLFFFILTHPGMTPVGAMRATPSGLKDELDWEDKGFPEDFTKAFTEGLLKGFWKYDPKAKFLLVPNFLKYNPPESPNVVKSWIGCWEDLPECELKRQLLHKLKGFTEGIGKGFGEAFGKAFAKTIANQEQEQEQYKDTQTGNITTLPTTSVGEGP